MVFPCLNLMKKEMKKVKIMNKIILLLLIISSIVLAGEQDGTGVPSSNSTSSDVVTYQLICTPIIELDSNSNQQENSQNCIIVEVQTNN